MIRVGIVMITILVAISGASAATWQETLNQNFDHAETFDDLQNWKGNQQGQVSILDYPNDFPKYINGSSSRWEYYSAYNPPSSRIVDWIGNHGADTVWKSNGKSMYITYGTPVNTSLMGTSRMAFTIGDNASSGYQDEVHIFYMSKWYKDFFITTDTSFKYHNFLKTFTASTGFRDVRHWGTVDEYNWVDNAGGTTQALNEYGLNAQVYNIQRYSGKLLLQNTYLTTSLNHYHYSSTEDILYDTTGIDRRVWNDEWFGTEIRAKQSNPHDVANGEFEFWIYDQNGTMVSHELVTGITNFNDGNTSFTHGWNKFDWGGNRWMCPTYCKCYEGTHDGGDNEIFMQDSTANINYSHEYGDYGPGSEIYNINKSSHGVITTYNSTNVTATKVGGGEFDWDNGDVYHIVQENSFSPLVGYFYIDDIIIDENRIGETYFNLTDDDFTPFTTKSYFNTTNPITNVVNSTGYHIWNRTPTQNDNVCNFNLEVTI